MDTALSIDTLTRRLRRAYMRAHRRDRNTVLGYLLAQTLLAFFAAYLLDRLTQFPGPVRIFVSLGILGAGLGWRLYRNAHVLRRKKNPEEIARDVERRARVARPGGFQSLLVSATEFGLLGRTPGSEELRQQVLIRAGESEYDPTKLVLHQQEDATRASKWILAAVIVYALWVLLAPSAMGIFFARAFGLPLAYPTRTVIESVEAQKIGARFVDIPFQVYASGELPAQGTIGISYTGSKRFDIPLMASPDTPGLYTALLERPQRDFDYQVELGDARGMKMTFRVVAPPVMGAAELKVYPPGYTGQLPQTRPMGSFEMVEGGRFDLEIVVEEPVASCELILGDTPMPMTKTEKGFRIESVKTTESVPYSVRMIGEGGVENSRRAEFTIRVLRDQPPQVTLVSPDRGGTVAPQSVIRWKFEAADDLGMGQAILQTRVIQPEVLGPEGEVLEEAKILATDEKVLADIQGASEITLDGSLVAESLGARPGTLLELRIHVADRYPERKKEEGWSSPATLQVVSGQELKTILAEELMGAHLMLQDIRDDMKRQRKAVDIRKDMTSETGNQK